MVALPARPMASDAIEVAAKIGLRPKPRSAWRASARIDMAELDCAFRQIVSCGC